ncbi:hypothetical protein [Carboxylicivirga sp. N1Y90]|uniref:hypothetical protein n=1 Tax=Carboxylicivirga fragile TaxID=3417571 RepID=UPI003D340428|nr:hypothetical protein [Marinilabiliaceae bacterium N1Y90]
MKSITEDISDYRAILMDLWNQNFTNTEKKQDLFNFEIDKAFSRVQDGLFESLVLAKSFDYPIARNPNGFFDQIVVVPKSYTIEVLAAIEHGIEWRWEKMEITKDNSKFCFIDLYDWDSFDKMDCQFARTRLIESNTLSARIGYDFLFNFDEVEIIKTNANTLV